MTTYNKQTLYNKERVEKFFVSWYQYNNVIKCLIMKTKVKQYYKADISALLIVCSL